MKTVGILIDESKFRSIPGRQTGHEQLQLYNRAAAKYGLTPVYLCLERTFVSLGSTYGYKYVKGKYTYCKLPIPKVIHNRAIPRSKRMERRLKHLLQVRNVFNANNRCSKYRIHKLLKNEFASNVPASIQYTKYNLKTMMANYNSLYIKPQLSSIGRGIIKAERRRDGMWKVQMPNGTIVTNKTTTGNKVHRLASKKKYMIQETIPLAKYKGNPFDIRVSVQRGSDGSWQVTGMVGKVARKGSHVTNVAQGGTVKSCDLLFRSSGLHASAVRRSVERLSLDIVNYVSKHLPHLADVGLDIGVTATGTPYFIELNCRDQRYSFKKAHMPRTFYRTYETPIAYAKYLMNRTFGIHK